jgi:hypothetical protein
MRSKAILLTLVLAATVLTGAGPAVAAGSGAGSGKARQVPVPAVEGPITGGRGTIALQSTSIDLAAEGYEQSEYFLAGAATSYTTPVDPGPDGKWTVSPADTSRYKTRVVVYRPIDPKRFDGTVYVEWLNVSGGMDAAPNWTLSHLEQMREGAAYVGVTAQRVGIVGSGKNPLIDAQTLHTIDPERYGSLDIPSDKYSYDIYSQAGAAVRDPSTHVLGGLRPKRVVSVGESRAAIYLTSYVNAIVPTTDQIYDGFLLHSRAGFAAAFDGTSLEGGRMPVTRIRGDLRVPVLTFITEADLVLLGYAQARQPDSARFRDWEVAGTSHYDTYALGFGPKDNGDGTADVGAFQTMITTVQSPYPGIVDCAHPINAGPQTYVLRAAMADLNRWVTTGTPPPHAPRLKLNPENPKTFLTDADGNAQGGIRTPHVDTPIADLSGLGQSGNGYCYLFGTTQPFDAEKIAALYPSHAKFVQQWNHAVDDAVAAGFVLKADAQHLKDAARQSTVGGSSTTPPTTGAASP